VTEETHYLALAAAYARGALGRPELDDRDALAAAEAADLRLHRFKRTAGLARVRRVMGVLRGLGATRILDVGSGRGAFLWPLLDQLPAAEVTAVDRLPHRVVDLQRVRRGGVRRLSAARMDGCALAFANRSFPVVTLLEVLEHMEAPQEAAREAVRVAAQAVIASVPSHEDDNPEHRHLFDRRALEAMFRAAGARRVAIDPVLGHLICTAMVS
jgi:ubiquinone/menaquinone biosynthesis C-methylase UbiE